MATPLHILAAQQEYASRKWLAYHSDRYCSTAHRFHKFGEAIEYLRDQAARVSKDTSQHGLTEMRQEMEGPGGLLDVSSLLKVETGR